VLSMQAIYKPSAVPSKYAGEPLSGFDDSRETMLALQSWGMMSKEQRLAILPFITYADGDVRRWLKSMRKRRR